MDDRTSTVIRLLIVGGAIIMIWHYFFNPKRKWMVIINLMMWILL